MSLSSTDKRELMRTMLASRLGDLREQSLIRQGKGMFHVSGMGHEGLAAIGRQMQPEDYLAPYYRDRALVQARGLSTYEIALEFFAKRASASGGRQMPGHFSSRRLNIWSLPSPVAANLLPACGIAWGMKMDRANGVVIATCGDAATRQGDFYEAGSLAKEMDLPMLFIVEDNGIGISSVTEKTTPKGLRLLKEEKWVQLDGIDIEAMHRAGSEALAHIRAGNGPVFMWCRTERMSSHSSADDQRKYRDPASLDGLASRCPVAAFKERLVADGVLSADECEELEKEVEAEVRRDYRRAEQESDPGPEEATTHVYGSADRVPDLDLDLGERTRLVDAVNGIFHRALESSREFVFYGQDIADPKGGVFSLTKGLSSAYPDNVFNSPLAESTILGVACGLASYGKRPVFEIQFIDFIYPGWNQLISNLATLRWRSFGEWKCPCVIYAPYGAYLPGGAVWHSQAQESAIAHFPGLRICVPSTPEDAAGLFWSAMQGQDPVVILIPKHLLWKEKSLNGDITAVPLGKARLVRQGTDVTVVTWGNCVEIAEAAVESLGENASVELIDLRTVAPWDQATVKASVRNTRRLVVVQEDTESCSIGQMILATLTADPELWETFVTPPMLVSKGDVFVGYAHAYEYGVLPDKSGVARAIRNVLGGTRERRGHETVAARAPLADGTEETGKVMLRAFADADITEPVRRREEIRVPLLGEGITHARVIQLIKKPDESVEEDDPICELETDKALFPVESQFTGILKEWLVSEEDEVEVGQPIAILESEEEVESHPRRIPVERRETAPSASPAIPTPSGGGLAQHVIGQMKNVVPTHMTVKAPWEAIRAARAAAKERYGDDAPSPTVMVAWCIVKAMEKHSIFCCTINARDTLTHCEDFDFGVAVSLQNDALDTAVIPKARHLSQEAFAQGYGAAVRAARAGNPASKVRTPLILTSMGGFNVRSALPVVVPPAIATLFVGEAHHDLRPGESGPGEWVNLCLSFDHRWINGVAGAAFLSDVRSFMQQYELPS